MDQKFSNKLEKKQQEIKLLKKVIEVSSEDLKYYQSCSCGCGSVTGKGSGA